MEHSWVDKETAETNLGDVRLNRRLGVMLEGNRCTRPTYSESLLMIRLARDDEEIGQCR